MFKCEVKLSQKAGLSNRLKQRKDSKKRISKRRKRNRIMILRKRKHLIILSLLTMKLMLIPHLKKKKKLKRTRGKERIKPEERRISKYSLLKMNRYFP
jgi:hypothetical protein